jgi:hypothetical protein
MPNGHFVGTQEQWQEGSLIGRDGGLTWTAFEFSKQCLAGLPKNPLTQPTKGVAHDGFN